MRTFYFLWLFTAIMLITSCKDKYNGPTVAQGQVVDATTGRGVPFAEITVLRDKRASATALDRTALAAQRADENGSFSFTIETSDDYYYHLDAQAEHYFAGAEGGAINNGEKNENMKVAIKPKGYIKFNVINEEPKEKIDLSINILNNGIFSLYRDTTFYGSYLGNNNLNLTWWINGSNSISKYDDKIYIPALDTVEYTIKY